MPIEAILTGLPSTWSQVLSSSTIIGKFTLKGSSLGTATASRIDAKFVKYLAWVDPSERKKLANEIQSEILENYYFVPVFRTLQCRRLGRVPAAKWQEVFPTITAAYAYPWGSRVDACSYSLAQRRKEWE
jgi:hypothetical protein